MSRKLMALDLYCGGGGATRGLQLAGFFVVGVDQKEQPRYCGDGFVRGDALMEHVDFSAFDFIWASLPCQRWTSLVQASKRQEHHPDLIEPTRRLLVRSGVPYCIENVPRAPIRRDLVLTGDMFGMDTYRKRHFELSFFALAPVPGRSFGPISRPGAETIVGHARGHSRRDRRGERRMRGTADRWREIMGIDWMLVHELVEAVPPAYAEWIARAWLAQRQSEVA
jgi:DNA (cytosine-5)-methyltransferase 1